MTVLEEIERVRKPKYTGHNRCHPCTIVNIIIAVWFAGTTALAIRKVTGSSVGLLVALLILVVSAAIIYLRGYLVPGTPWLTTTYLPDWVLKRFDKHPNHNDAGDVEFDIESVLSGADAVEPCEHDSDLCLTDEFQALWDERISAIKDHSSPKTELASLLGTDVNSLRIEKYGDAFVSTIDDIQIGQWESRAALLADLAAGAELQERIADWDQFSVQQRNQLLYGLRVFIDTCPVCDGSVTMDEETVESCCRSIDIIAISCDECNARIFEVEHPYGT